MAKVQLVCGEDRFVPVLNREVKDGDVVEIPDDLFAAFVPPAEHRHPDHPWKAIEAPAKAAKAVDKKDK